MQYNGLTQQGITDILMRAVHLLAACVLCRSMRLLQNTSRGVGDLIMVYKRMTSLAGHTSRVSELLEQVGSQLPCSLTYMFFPVVTRVFSASSGCRSCPAMACGKFCV
jgi:hypothetical protein